MTVLPQRTDAACGVTALAMFLAFVAMRKVDPDMLGLESLYNRELIRAAKALGLRLRATRRFRLTQLDREQGILRVRWKNDEERAANPNGHFVALILGNIYCPSKHVVLPWREYCVRYKANPCTLLREVA
jgi:hypothetical protein